MRKAFDTNVPKLKPRLRPAMVVVSDTTPEKKDEDVNIAIDQANSETVTNPPDEVLNLNPANTSETESTTNDFSSKPTNEEMRAGAGTEEAHITIPKGEEDIDQNIVPFPDTTSRKNEGSKTKKDSQDQHRLHMQGVPLIEISTDSEIKETIHSDIANEQLRSSDNLEIDPVEAQSVRQATPSDQATESSVIPVFTIDDSDTRRKRLEDVKRRVTEAVRPEIRIEPVPDDPALAVESVLELVSDLEAQLTRSREVEKALRNELAEAKADLTRTISDGRTASERLVQTEAQLDEKRKILEEMLFEMGALEQERDQAVRMVQMLTVKDKERQLEFDNLQLQFTELQRVIDENRIEEERLTCELDGYITENTRLHTLLTEITKERDSLVRNVEHLTKECDDLTEAKKALEKVHTALSRARARLRE